MKIVLLNGPCVRKFARTGRWQAVSRGASLWYPIWLAAAAAVLKREGFNCRLIDAPALGLDLAETLSILKQDAFDLCVIDTSTPSINHDFATAEAIKEEFGRRVKVCFVGPHASALPDEMLKHQAVDYVAISEYDYTLVEVARRIKYDAGDEMRGVSGLLARSRAGYLVRNPPRPLIDPLNELPFASSAIFEHLDVSRYRLDFTLHPYMNIMTSRGCPGKCIFCLWPQTLTRGKFRERSLGHVFSEIDFVLSRKPRIREIFFDDDTFTPRAQRVEEFCRRYIDAGYSTPFSVNTKADVTDFRLLKLMKKAGLRCFVVGFESGDQKILDRIGKGVRLEQMKEFAAACRKLGIQVHGDFVVGLPGETSQTIRSTVRFASQLSLSTFQLSIAMPFPGTEFYRWLQKNNYLAASDFSSWLDANGLQKCVVNYPDLSSAQIEKAVVGAIRKYYLSPRFIMHAAAQGLRNPYELGRYISGGMRMAQFLFKSRA